MYISLSCFTAGISNVIYDVIIQMYHHAVRCNNKIFIALIKFLRLGEIFYFRCAYYRRIRRREDYDVHSITLYIEKPKA